LTFQTSLYVAVWSANAICNISWLSRSRLSRYNCST